MYMYEMVKEIKLSIFFSPSFRMSSLVECVIIKNSHIFSFIVLEIKVEKLEILEFILRLIITKNMFMSVVSFQNRRFLHAGLPELYSQKIMDSTTKVREKVSLCLKRSVILFYKCLLLNLMFFLIQATRKIGVFKSDDTILPKSIKHDPFKKNNGKQHLDAVTQMINMLNKDYQAKARRRPPINNSSPLKDEADHVKH